MPATRPLSWRACPVLVGAGCLAAGIVLAEQVDLRPYWLWALGLIPALISAFLQPRRLITLFPLGRVLAVGMALVAAGALCFSILRTPIPSPLTVLAASQPEHVIVTGAIAGAPERNERGRQFDLEIQSVQLVSGKAFPLQGAIHVYVYDTTMARVHEGDLVQLSGEMRSLPKQTNPGTFDYGLYLRRHGISAMFHADEEAGVSRIGETRGIAMEATVAARSHVRRILRTYVRDQPTRAILHALILGQRQHIREATLDAFKSTGLLHLLAVSGLHVLLVGFVIYRLLQPVLLRFGLAWRQVEWLRVGLTMLLLGLYMLLTGATASVVRAVLMAGFFLGGTLLQRRSHSLNTLGGAALAILIFRPAQLFDVGFQLSFAAVAALILLPPIIKERRINRSTGIRQLADSLIASAAAILGALPILLFHFGRVSIAGLLLNVPAIPASMLALASGFLVVIFGGWWPAAAAVSSFSAAYWVQILLSIAHFGDKYLKWAAVEVTVSSLWAVAAISLLLCAIAFIRVPRRRWRLVVASLVLLILGIWMPLLRSSHEVKLRVLFFDVGHGDAALISFPNGRHLLIDAGPGGRYAHTAERILLPFLRRRGIDRLDAVLITHPHSDHLGGLPTLLRRIPVERVLTNGYPHTSNLYDESQHVMDSLRIPQHTLRAGDTLSIDPSVALQILSPMKGPQEINNTSIALRMIYGETHWLFLGDIESEVEQRLLKYYPSLLASDVIKVAHHGSRTSSTSSFVRQVVHHPGEERAIVSVEEGGLFGLPDEDVISRWSSSGARVLITSDGAVWLESDGKRISLIGWMEGESAQVFSTGSF